MFTLQETTLIPSAEPIPETAVRFMDEGLRRGKKIACFDWVPSNYSVVYATLAALPRGRFCEWGSGMGIVTGLAEMLGFTARGIEIDAQLVAASRTLLADFGLAAPIDLGDYYEIDQEADTYFTYCWPGQITRAEERFLSAAPDSARLLICHGAEDIRCQEKVAAP